MTITGGSALPKEDIDRMVHEAEAHAEDDKKRREEADTRNLAEQTVYSMEKLLKDNADKISEGTRSEVQGDVDALKKALEGEDTDAVKAALDKLNESGMKVGQEVYSAQQAAESEAPAGEGDAQSSDSEGAQSASSDDDVIDAEIVDEDDNK